MKTIRCAIYTRKSVDEGLDDTCSSLDAQRDFCEEYIKNQQHNGWEVLPKHYDDGGYSGKNMKRPAMKELIKDIENGEIDVLVAYKVDRLSRSLLDFANFSLFLEEHHVSFVLVTQQIDTTTTMGRMQINLLMTFAQYEREMCSDRIKDKVAIMKQRGMWTGGHRPYGYDIKDRQLFVNEEEAEGVRELFRLYPKMGSTRLVAHALNEKDFRYNNGTGKWDAKIVYRLLQSKLYLGTITHRNKDYEGQHEAIISKELWENVQVLRTQRLAYCQHSDDISIGLLRSIVYCQRCDQPMRVEIHTQNTNVKGIRKYAYYACPRGSNGSVRGSLCRATRTSTARIDNFILKCCQKLLIDHKECIAKIANLLEREPYEVRDVLIEEPDILQKLSPFEQFILIRTLIKKVVIGENDIHITYNENVLSHIDGSPKIITYPSILTKNEYVFQNKTPWPQEWAPSKIALLKAYLEAKHLAYNFKKLGFCRLQDFANYIHEDPACLRRKLLLTQISPNIIRSILFQKGGHHLTVNKLTKIAHLPWKEQELAAEL
jgi:site-specific DNA recombinase